MNWPPSQASGQDYRRWFPKTSELYPGLRRPRHRLDREGDVKKWSGSAEEHFEPEGREFDRRTPQMCYIS